MLKRPFAPSLLLLSLRRCTRTCTSWPPIQPQNEQAFILNLSSLGRRRESKQLIESLAIGGDEQARQDEGQAQQAHSQRIPRPVIAHSKEAEQRNIGKYFPDVQIHPPVGALAPAHPRLENPIHCPTHRHQQQKARPEQLQKIHKSGKREGKKAFSSPQMQNASFSSSKLEGRRAEH